MNAYLTVPNDPEPILQSDLRPRVESEEVTGDIAGIRIERLRKPVRHAKRALEARDPQGGGEADQREIGFSRMHTHIIIGIDRWSRGCSAVTRPRRCC
jgi:hypothetical protein